MSDNFSITGQHQTSMLDPAGRFTQVIEVTFSTPGVGTGTIEVPVSDYNADRVRDLVRERVAHMEAVHQLGNATGR